MSTSLTTALDRQALLLDDHSWPRSWHAEWIGAEAPGDAVDPLAALDGAEEGKFGRHIYRGLLRLEHSPKTAPLRVTADSRYVLFVNGIEAGRGPVRSQPRRLRYDTYDIAPLLREGENVIVVLVTFYGKPNSFWQPAAANSTLGKAGILALEALVDGRWFGTDRAWAVRPATAWSEAPRKGSDGVPVEIFDARQLEPGWAEGKSGDWQPAHVRPADHLGSLARTHPPTDPYGPMLPRPIGALGGETVRPVAVQLGAASVALEVGPSPATHVLGSWGSVASELAPQEAPGQIRFGAAAETARAVAFDFGRVVAGHCAFELEASAGTVVDVLFRETPPSGGDEFGPSVPKTGLRYIARGSGDSFIAMEVNGLRFAHLIITTPQDGKVVLRDFRIQEFLYPRTGSSFFRSSDQELDALYEAGIRTVALNSQDAFTDCPTREQRAWVGDGVVHQLVHLTTSDDWRLAKWYVELGNSPRPDGILPMSVVGEIESKQLFTIPDWSLYWINAVYNVMEYMGDRAALAAAAPTAKRILDWFVPYLDDNGVLADVPEWGLVDWSSILLTGSSSILTGLWARALLQYAEVSDYLGNAGDAEWARGLWAAAQSGFEVFWDESRGTYVDHVLDGLRQAPASQLAGALAVVSGLAPAHRVHRVIAWIGNEHRHVVRSWIGGNGGYDQAKILDQIRGIQRIDWDADEEVVVAEPFAAYLVHDAYAAAGRSDLLRRSLGRWNSFLKGGYDTFGECWGWGTPVHGWSSTPARDIVQRIVGVTPAEPGFLSARIAPAYGVVDRFEASVPTPFGPIRVTVEGRAARVDSPIPFVLLGAEESEGSRQA